METRDVESVVPVQIYMSGFFDGDKRCILSLVADISKIGFQVKITLLNVLEANRDECIITEKTKETVIVKPKVYGIAFVTSLQDVRPVFFEEREPFLPYRILLSMFNTNYVETVYDGNQCDKFIVENKMREIPSASYLLEQTDTEILCNSTSPQAEPDRFCTDIRSAAKFQITASPETLECRAFEFVCLENGNWVTETAVADIFEKPSSCRIF